MLVRLLSRPEVTLFSWSWPVDVTLDAGWGHDSMIGGGRRGDSGIREVG